MIGVIGLGKLGLPLAYCLSKHYKVIGIEKGHYCNTNKEIDYVPTVYMNYKKVKHCKIVFIIVPTPSIENGSFTNAFIEEALQELHKINYKRVVSIVSTMSPGSTHALTRKYGLRIVYNPTFIALGSVVHDLLHPSFVLVGGEKKDIKIVCDIWTKVCNPKFAIMTSLEAEICKLSLNCFLTTKISFANTIGNVCDRLGIDGERVMQAIGMDKRVNPAYLTPGLGFGGPCFPRDNKAFAFFANQLGCNASMAYATMSVNDYQPTAIITKIRSLGITEISIPHLSYKKGTDNMEKSQLKIIHDELIKLGYKINPKAKWELNWGGLCKKGHSV